LTTLTLNRSTTTPVKAWQNRLVSPGTASGEGPKSRSTTICNGRITMVGDTTLSCAQSHCQGTAVESQAKCARTLRITSAMFYNNFW
jgi:hypothetical protein